MYIYVYIYIYICKIVQINDILNSNYEKLKNELLK